MLEPRITNPCGSRNHSRPQDAIHNLMEWVVSLLFVARFKTNLATFSVEMPLATSRRTYPAVL